MTTHDGYTVIDAAEGGEMYEWSIAAALYHPENDAYYLYEDGGCSCYYAFEEGWEAGPAMSKQELISTINNRRTDLGYFLRLEDYIDLAQAVREFNPKENQ